MKKLAIALAGALFLAAAAPVFACPHEDQENNEAKTAEKDKDKAKTPEKDKATTADKDKPAKTKAPAKKADEKKPADKVSLK